MNRRQHNALIMLARYPRPGRVKSRLASTVGEETAADVARLCAERLFVESNRLPPSVRRYLFFADPADAQAMRRWAGDDFRLKPQITGNFGGRMAAAFRTAFGEGAHKAVIVGSDIPDLSESLLQDAFHLLDHYPLVIGPDLGGGYYLLGMKMLYADLFLRDVTWGTNRVLAQTLRIMEVLELVPAFLPALIDIDTEGDARRWLRSRKPQSGRRLEQYLRRQLGM